MDILKNFMLLFFTLTLLTYLTENKVEHQYFNDSSSIQEALLHQELEFSPQKYNIDFVDNANSFYSASNDNKILKPVVKLLYLEEVAGVRRVFSSATGFSIDYVKSENASYIITNDHFCRRYSEGGEFVYQDYDTPFTQDRLFISGRAVIIKQDPTKDLCLLRAQGKVKPAKLASKKYRYHQFEKVTSVGAPAGVFPVKTESVISSIAFREILPEHMWEGDNLLIISSEGFGGQSGSPLYNKDEKVIGVVFMNYNNYDGTVPGTFCIPISDLYVFLEGTGVKNF